MTARKPKPNNLEQLRDQQGLTVAGLAHVLGVAPAHVRRWQLGYHVPSRTAQRMIAQVLSCTVEALGFKSPSNPDIKTALPNRRS